MSFLNFILLLTGQFVVPDWASILKHWSHIRNAELFHSLVRDAFVYITKISYDSRDFFSFRGKIFCILLDFELTVKLHS